MVTAEKSTVSLSEMLWVLREYFLPLLTDNNYFSSMAHRPRDKPATAPPPLMGRR